MGVHVVPAADDRLRPVRIGVGTRSGRVSLVTKPPSPLVSTLLPKKLHVASAPTRRGGAAGGAPSASAQSSTSQSPCVAERAQLREVGDDAVEMRGDRRRACAA